MRKLLHRAAAEITPLPLASGALDELTKIQSAHDSAIQDEDPPEVFQQNERFHTALINACDNRVLEEALNHCNKRIWFGRSHFVL